AGAAAANRNQPAMSGAQGAAVGAAAANRNPGYDAMRNSYAGSSMYGHAWYASTGAWAPTGWVAGAAWGQPAWGAVAGLGGYNAAAPMSYDYGVNVTSQNGNVMMNGQSLGTTAQFSQQAADLAQTGTDADVSTTGQWMPLGVFAMARNHNDPERFVVQLAIND